MKLSIVLLLSFVSWAGIAPGLWFEPNLGQAHPSVQFLARTSHGYVYLGRNQMAVQVNGKPVRMELERASGSAQGVLEEPLGAISSYFSGQTEKDWHTGIPHYARVHYKDVYPGIDLVYYAHGRDLEYDFRLQPGADPSVIRLAFNEPVHTDTNGDLLVGGLRQKRPKVYQNGHEVACDYLARAAHHVQLALAAYDRAQPLTVDPVLVFSTYLGGPGDDVADGVALDSQGFIYLALSTQSPAAPILDPFQQETIAVLQPSVFKFTPDGQHIVYYSILNSGSWDGTNSLTVDSTGSPILVGFTESARFPLMNPVQSVNNAAIWTGFITKFTPDGISLVYSTYFGGSDSTDIWSIAVDQQGNAYFAGDTYSRDIPVKNAIQPQYAGSSDCFVGKLSTTGDLIFSTYYGGSAIEYCHGLDLGPDGNIVLGGSSHSADFPFKNPIQTVFTQRLNPGYNTPILVKLTADGQTIIFATYFGGPVVGDVAAVKHDAAGDIYTAGGVEDNMLAVKNPYQTYPGAPSAFLTKFDSTLGLIYSTYLGGSSGDATAANALAVGADDSVYVSGTAGSADFPVKNSLQPFRGGGIDNVDAFVTKFDPSGSSLIYSTFLGGHGEEWVSQIALDPKGNVYVAGLTLSQDFPVANAFQPTYGGGGDGFMAEISDDTPVSRSPLTLTPGRLVFQFVQGGSAPPAQTVTVTGPSFATSVSDSWIAVSTPAPGTVSVSINTAGLAPGAYGGTVSLTPQAGTPATIDVGLTVLSPAPVLSSITPALVGIGSGATAIVIHGSGFTSQTMLLLDGTAWQQTPVTVVNSGTVQVTFPKAALAAQASFALSAQNPQSAISNILMLTVGQFGPQFSAATVLNAASFAGGPVAPGEIVSIFGTNLNQSVTFDGIPATLVYFSPSQVNVTVPYQVAGETSTQLVVGQYAISAVPVTLDVAPAAPGIFAAVPVGTNIVTMYATGCGVLTTGALPQFTLPISVTANGQAGQVLYAGVAPGLDQGVDQVNVQFSDALPSGKVSFVLTVGSASSPSYSIVLP
jgi:uncharacterized protein (TIGR03437 family)